MSTMHSPPHPGETLREDVLSALGLTVTVAAGKTWELKPHAAMLQADGKIYIDCDVAGSILVLV